MPVGVGLTYTSAESTREPSSQSWEERPSPARGKKSKDIFNSNSQGFIDYQGGKLEINVLVLSTDPDVRGALVQTLRLLGCRRVSESTNIEVLRILLELEPERSSSSVSLSPQIAKSNKIGLIFCDLHLCAEALQVVAKLDEGVKGASGIAATSQSDSSISAEMLDANRRKLSIPVVVLCEKRFAREKLSEVLDSGASGYLTKPLRIHSIRGALVRHGGLKAKPASQAGEELSKNASGGVRHYEKVAQIGRGAFGEVFLVERDDKTKFAQKEIKIKNLDAKAQRRVLTELALHRSFDFPFLVRAYGAWINADYAYIMMEYVEEGALSRRVSDCQENNEEIPDNLILTWSGQILMGLMYLHSKDVIHRDLKLENVLGPDLLDRVKLTDFGISREMTGDTDAAMSMTVGTPLCLAPERVPRLNDNEEQKYGIASDMWSMGVSMYELTMLFHPFKEKKETSTSSPGTKKNSIFSNISQVEAPPLPFSRAAVLHRVITGGLLQKQPTRRPTALQLCQEPEFSAAMHDALKRCSLLGSAGVLEVLSVVNIGNTVGVAMPSEDACDAVALQKGQATKSLEESVVPLVIEMEATFPAPHSEEDEERKSRNALNKRFNLSEDSSQMQSRIDELKGELDDEREGKDRSEKLAEARQRKLEELDLLIHDFLSGQKLTWSLRFKDPALETEYIYASTSRFNLHSVATAAVLSAICCILSLLQLSKFQEFDVDVSSRRHVAVLVIIGLVFLCVVRLALIFCMQCARSVMADKEPRRRLQSTRVLQLTSSALVLFLAVLAALVEPMLEESVGKPKSMFFGIALMPHVAITFACIPLVLPVRWWVLLCLHVLFVAAFAASVGPMLEWQDALWRTACLCTLSTGMLLERRATEFGERFQVLLSTGAAAAQKTHVLRYNTGPGWMSEATSDPVGNSEGTEVNAGEPTTTMHRGAGQSRQPTAKPGLVRSDSMMSDHMRRSFQRKERVAQSTSSVLSVGALARFGRSGTAMSLRSGTAMSLESETVFADVVEDSHLTRADSLRSIMKQGSKESWLLPAHRVQVDSTNNESLGSGGFGCVLRGTLYGASVALKLPRAEDGQGNANSLSNELRVLRHVWHPHIVRFYGSCIDPGSAGMVLVLELIQGLQLDTLCCDDELRDPTAHMRRQLLLDISSALRYLHTQKPCIVHGDLKGSNILVEMWLSGPRAKLLDFGLSRLLTKKAIRNQTLGGTVKWMAPEVIRGSQGGPPAPSADVFSFGRLAFMVVVGRRPLLGVPPEVVVQNVRQFIITPLDWPPVSDHIPLCKQCENLTERCLMLAAIMRPSISEVHSWLRQWNLPGDGQDGAELGEPQGITSLELGLLAVCKDHIAKTRWSKLWMLLRTGKLPNDEERATKLLRQIEVAAKHRYRLIMPERLMLIPDKVLAVGAFGFVIDARLDGIRAVVRVPRGPLKVTRPAQMTRLLGRMKELMLIRHPCIVAFHGLCVEQDLGVVTPVLEYVEGVPLDTFVKNAALGLGRIPVETRHKLIAGIGSALWCLHEQKPPIVHGDLKGTNILVESRADGAPIAKLLDYGWSRVLAQEGSGRSRLGGRFFPTSSSGENLGENSTGKLDLGSSPYGLGKRPRNMLMMAIRWRLTSRRRALVWTAPEVLNEKRMGGEDAQETLEPTADVFSFGRIIYLVLTGHDPLYHCEAKDIEEAVKRNSTPPLEWPNAWPEMRRGASGDILATAKVVAGFVGCGRPLVERCCNSAAEMRPTIDTVHQDITSWTVHREPTSTINERSASSSKQLSREESRSLSSLLEGTILADGEKLAPRSIYAKPIGLPILRLPQAQELLHVETSGPPPGMSPQMSARSLSVTFADEAGGAVGSARRPRGNSGQGEAMSSQRSSKVSGPGGASSSLALLPCQQGVPQPPAPLPVEFSGDLMQSSLKPLPPGSAAGGPVAFRGSKHV